MIRHHQPLARPATAPGGFGDAGAVRCLLDLDPDLGGELGLEPLRAARAAATALTLEAEPGQLALSGWLERAGPGLGVLVLEGVLALSVRVGDRTSVELLGAGDLLQSMGDDPDRLLACDVSWRALVPVRLAVLDETFVRRVRFWPHITRALMRRVGQRAMNLSVQRAIAAHPRLEVRLALLLWHLASRWGRVEPGGIRLPVPLTHQLLGQLVGAERPSVSVALRRLAQSGLVSGHGDEWHLRGELEHRLPEMMEAAGRARLIVAALSR